MPTEHITTDDIDPAAVADGEEVYQDHGIEHPILLDNCVFDVAITGEEEFAIDTRELVTPTAEEQAAETMDENDAKLQVLLETTAESEEFSFEAGGRSGLSLFQRTATLRLRRTRKPFIR